MNEFDRMNGEGNDADEIVRIQNEIDRMLNPTPQPAEQTAETIGDPAPEAPPVAEPPVTEMIVPEPAATDRPASEAFTGSSPEPAAEPPAAERPMFYHETIKKKSGEKKGFKRLVAFLTAACVLGGTAGGFFVGLNMPKERNAMSAKDAGGQQAPAVVETITTTVDPDDEASAFAFNDIAEPKRTAGDSDLRAMSNRFVDIVNELEPAVVAVTRTTMSSRRSFYGYDEGGETADGAGSGIIFGQDDEKIYILTNQHVVSMADNVYVSVSGSDTVIARHVGSDSRADLAVISVLKSDLKKVGVDQVVVAPFGDSDDLQVGEVVLAIGNALGEGNSTSMGLIGTKEKEVQINEHDQPLTLIQTSASINFGNSGGPLINLDGEVIGINTAKANPMVGAEGMGYSIPSNIAKPIVEELMNRSNTPFLGISGSTITEEFASMYSLPEAGVLVISVFEDSSAARAGIKRTDIITSFNGEPVFTIEQLTEKIKTCKVGDKAEIQIIRDGKTPMTVEATLDKYSDTGFQQ